MARGDSPRDLTKKRQMRMPCSRSCWIPAIFGGLGVAVTLWSMSLFAVLLCLIGLLFGEFADGTRPRWHGR